MTAETPSPSDSGPQRDTTGEPVEDSPVEDTPGAGGDDFVQLFTRHQRRLYLYILAQVPNPVDAEEILQEANVVIWRKFSQFEPESNFFAWCCQIARYEVLKYRDRWRKQRERFSDIFIEEVAAAAEQESDNLEDRRQALIDCLGKLRPRDRELIQCRYAPGASGKTVAKLLRRPVNSVYQSLGRIRRSLLECISRRLAGEAGS